MPYAVNGGVRLHYEVVGHGPPLFLHIGMFGAVEDWHDAGYVAALQDAYRLVLLDPRGQGQSDAPHDPEAYGPGQRVSDVLAVLDTEGIERAQYWGYSLGGGTGLAVAARAPHRLNSLIVGGADPYPRSDQDEHGHPWLPLLRQGMEGLVAACDTQDPDFFASPGERRRWLRLDALAMTAALQATPVTSDVAEVLPRLTMPSLLYRGTADHPELTTRAAQAMPCARFVPLVGLDHAQAINRSDLVLPHVMPFLMEVVASSAS